MKKLFSFFALSVLAGLSGAANAAMVHQYTFNDAGLAEDAIGTADLTVNGDAVVADGVLTLPGGGTRTHNASATGDALTELAATINGTTGLTIEIWFSQSENTGWAKLLMAGSSDSNYMDITPRRGNDGDISSCSLNTGSGESNARLLDTDPISNNTDYYIAAIWDQTANSITVYLAEADNPASAVTASDQLGGKLLSDLVLNEFYLGSAVAFGDGDYRGAINEVRIHDNALTEAELAASCLAGPETVIAALVAPADGKELISTATDLAWKAPNAYNPAGYNVYIGSDPNIDDASAMDWSDTSINPDSDMSYALDNDVTYYWRVDTLEPNGVDSIVHTGAVWSFTTIPSIPVVDTDPASQTVAAGTVIDLSVTAFNTDEYTWYYSADPIADETDNVIGSGQTIQVTVADVTDEGWYYCKASSIVGEDTSGMAQVMTERLVGWWPLDGDLTDAVASVVPGAPAHDAAAISESYVTGIETQAYQFSGDGQVITVTDSIDYFNFYTQGLTVCCWVKDQDPTIWDTVVSKEYDRDIDWSVGKGYYIARNPGGAGAFGVRPSETFSPNNTISTGDGSWHLITGVIDAANNTVKVYVDGEFRGENTNANPANFNKPNLAPLIFGAESTDGTVGMSKAAIDDVKIWNYPLTSWDIAELYVSSVDATICVERPAGDLEEDCVIDLKDFAVIATNWLVDGSVSSEN